MNSLGAGWKLDEGCCLRLQSETDWDGEVYSSAHWKAEGDLGEASPHCQGQFLTDGAVCCQTELGRETPWPWGGVRAEYCFIEVITGNGGVARDTEGMLRTVHQHNSVWWQLPSLTWMPRGRRSASHLLVSAHAGTRSLSYVRNKERVLCPISFLQPFSRKADSGSRLHSISFVIPLHTSVLFHTLKSHLPLEFFPSFPPSPLSLLPCTPPPPNLYFSALMFVWDCQSFNSIFPSWIKV